MAQTLAPGLIGQAAVQVTEDNTAERFGNKGASVFATPMLVALMEQAAIKAVANQLECGESTVGTRLDVKHLAATPIGLTVTATAELIEVSGKKLIFKVNACDNHEKVGEGIHERYIIKQEHFLQKVSEKTNRKA